MIQAQMVHNVVSVNFSRNQVVNLEKFRRIYRLVKRLYNQNRQAPVLINLEVDVRFKNEAKTVFNRLKPQLSGITLIIITEEV